MPRVTLIQQIYKSRRYIQQVYSAMLAQTYKDIQVIAQVTLDDGGCKQYIAEHYPQVKILDPGYNIGFAKGHNEIFASVDSEFFQLVNPDLILEPTYVEEMLKAFLDPQVGAATGKLLRYNFDTNQKTNIIDTTGVVIQKSGRARDRGQHEEDRGQYDNQFNLIAVSGAGPMYRKSAIEAVKMPGRQYYHTTEYSSIVERGVSEYFDEDFNSYWEDVDLGWRMTNAGWKSVFVPEAVAYHGRNAGSSEDGYKKVFSFIKHHKKISKWVRQLNYKNHIFLFIKNSPKWYPQFFIRELFYQGYVLVLETTTLGIFPTFFKQLPLMLKKRKWIKEHRKIGVEEMEKLLA